MKKFLVPIDFSDTSIHAAEYAVKIAQSLPEAQLFLYHVYSKISFSALTSTDEGSRQKVSELELESIKNKIANGFNNISCVVEDGSFLENIAEHTLSHDIDLVIMGITGSSKISQVFMGTNTLNVIRHISCPVMIIPPNAEYTGMKKVLFTSDFDDVARTTPFVALSKILDTFKPSLDILNVDSEHYVELTEEFKLERDAMEMKLNQYHPEFSFLRAFDFLDGINEYVEAKHIDAIITVPRKHSFISQLFKTSHTKKLAYHSTVPIIAIPE
ncbi:MAG: universal stress protein [Ginsengibacter sp.]|jgi:nucleotide-binding universal stress UspA family protein